MAGYYDENGYWVDPDTTNPPWDPGIPMSDPYGSGDNGIDVYGGGDYGNLDTPPPLVSTNFLDTLDPGLPSGAGDSSMVDSFTMPDPYAGLFDGQASDPYAGMFVGPQQAGAASDKSNWAKAGSFFSDLLKSGGGASTGAMNAGQMAGQSAQSAAQGRATEAAIQNNLMQNQIARGNMEVNQKQFEVTAPQQRAKTSTIGSNLANAQDFQFGQSSNPKVQPTQTTGGIRPSNFSPETRALGRQLSQDALSQQLAGDAFTPVKDPKYPEAGFMENLNKYGANGMSIWKLISEMAAQQ
jgi:hypothetical protein